MIAVPSIRPLTSLRFCITLLVLAALAWLSSSATPAQAAPDALYIVSPSNLNGWTLINENGAPTINFEPGPATPPLSSGSLQAILPTGSDGGGAFLVDRYEGTRLADITTLQYATYQTSNGGARAYALQLAVDDNLTDANTAFQGRLVYEPYLNNGGTVPTGTWQTWDTLSGGNARWWSSPNGNTTLDETCPQASPCTLTTILTTFPNVGILNQAGPSLTLDLKAGSGWAGFEGNADALRIVTSTGLNDTYDFEPSCPGGTATNTDTGEQFCSIQAAIDDANTVNGHTIQISAGTFNENVTVNKDLTLDGAGAGTDPTQHTILDGNSPNNVTNNPGIRIANGITGVTIQDVRVQDYLNQSGILAELRNNNLTVQRVHVVNNGRVGSSDAGLYANGPVSNVVFDEVLAEGNRTRGIVIWNGFKQNITITDSTARGNSCCGIELQDGSASGVTMTGNLSENNGDSGMAAIGLTSGAGPNVIAGNTVTNNGRFGIEIKNPNGTGLTTGDGSIVVENNTVSRTSVPADARDLAGISVYRRGVIVANGNVDVPTGVVVRSNTVSGYQQTTQSDGFGIVVEGTNTRVEGNTLSNNDVGLQWQAGHQPYPGDGDQSNLPDQYFGRGNSPVTCVTIGTNTFNTNTVNTRAVGPAGTPTVTNTNTTETFCTIQSAIDDPNTVNGHTISIGAGTYEEQVEVNKAITLDGAGVGTTIIRSPMTLTKFFVTSGSTNNYPIVYVHDVGTATIRDLTVDGAGRGNNNVRFLGIAYRNAGGTVDDVTVTGVRNNPIDGVEHGISVYALADNGTARTLNVTDSTLTDFQKNGTVFAGANLTVNVMDNMVTGAGPIDEIGQNGIQVSSGATGVVDGNTVSGFVFDPFTASAVGIIIVETPNNIVVSNNTVSDSTVDIWYIDAQGSITGNTVNHSAANMGTTDYWWGIVADPGEGDAPQPPASPVDPNLGAKGGSSDAPLLLTTTVTNNSLNGGGNGTGIEADALGTETLDFTATNNSVTNWDTGVVLYKDSGATLNSTVRYNSLTNMASAGLDNQSGGNPNATCNWWDHISGPTTTANPGGMGETLTGSATFSPWLVYGTDASPNIGFQLPTSFTVTAAGDTSAADNGYRRPANAIGCVVDGQTITFSGTFDWTQPNAAASWANGVDGTPVALPRGGEAATERRASVARSSDAEASAPEAPTLAPADNYSILVPANVNNVTLTAASLGSATFQGPGDVASADLEGFLYFDGSGLNQNWTMSNLTILDMDLSIGMFNDAGGVASYNDTEITNNRIRIATDALGAADSFQNIGIHYSFGTNQTISNNQIEIRGNGVSNSGGGDYSSSYGMQSNTSGGAVYDGLQITGNTISVLNAQSSDPEDVLGIWENGHAHLSDITVSGNTFTNLAAGNDPDLNYQLAFYVTSHSSANTTVAYSNNIVQGPEMGFLWLNSTYTGNQPVQLTNNTLTDVNTGVVVRGPGLATISANSITRGGTTRAGAGVDVRAGSVVTVGGPTNANNNTISGFDQGVLTAGTTTVNRNANTITGNNTGIQVSGGTATITSNDIRNNTVGVLVTDGAENTTLTNNDIVGNSSFGVQNVDFSTNTPVNALGNYWGDPTGPDDDNGPGADRCGLTLYNPNSVGDDVSTCVNWGSPLVVTLASFEANEAGDHVQVAWETTLETNNAGFNLLRATTVGGERTRLNGTLIASQGSQGAAYTWQDQAVVSGTTYFYWLEAVDTQGGTRLYGPVSVTYEATSAVTVGTLSASTPGGFPLGALVALGVAGLVSWAVRRQRRA